MSFTTAHAPRLLCRVVVAFCLSLLLSFRPASGADSPAVVTGRVTNAATGDVLTSVVVAVEGTEVRATTDLNGNYRVVLPAGVRTLVVSYPGLDDQRVSVDAAAGQAAVRDVALTTSLYKLEKFVVKGLREGQAAAIQEERQSANLRTVAAIDAFGNPGAAVGEMLQRLPGVAVDGSGGEVGAIYIRGMTQDFSSLSVDGSQIAVSGGTAISNGNVYFGQVSTGTLASAEIVKSPTPDMDGNAIAGYLNLRTKRAFDRTPGRQISLSLGTAWGESYEHRSVPYKDRPELDLFNLSFSDVYSIFGGRNNFGLVATVQRNIANGMITEVGPRQASAAQTSFFVASAAPDEPLQRAYGAGQWGSLGKQSPTLNLSLNTDYKLSENTTLSFKSTYNRVKRRSGSLPSYYRWKLTTTAAAANFLPGSTYDSLEARNGTLDLESVLYIRESESATFSGGVEQRLFGGSGKLTVDLNYSKNRTMYPQLNQIGARLTGVGWQLDRRGHGDWDPAVIQTVGKDWRDPASYVVRPDAQLISYSAPAQRWGGRADLENTFNTAVPFTLKLGAKQTGFYQKSNRNINYYTYVGPTAGGITPWVGNPMRMSGGRYGPFPFMQLAQSGLGGDVFADSGNWTQTASDVWNTIVQDRLNDAEFEETINSGYVQGSFKLHRLRVLTGLRLEQTETTGTSYVRVVNATNTNLTTATPAVNAARALANFRGGTTDGTRYNNTFPGLHLVYDVTPDISARASYSKSITRPTPTSLLPNITPNENNSTLSGGNPDLKPYTSDNFDVSVAKYFPGIGQLSAGVFLKQITNYFRSFQSTVPSGPDNGFGGEYAGWTLTQNRNIGSARIRGIELNHQQQYTFLPGVLRGLGSFANFTYLDTKGDFGAAATTTRLANLTPRSANAGLTWRYRGLDLRILMNYRSEFFRSSTSGTYGSGAGVVPGTMLYDVYQHAKTLWDFKAQYNYSRTYTFFFDVYNLTNDWTNSDYVHAFGREIPSYASGVGTSFKLGMTVRL
ncbi:MAG: TonB-dependent receptor [Verrucomicrobia bacterium]|nr:TonB-dependent receptor [Verrucomicrobiota bacterium]